MFAHSINHGSTMVAECRIVESCFLEFMWHINLKPFLHFLQITKAFKVVGKMVFTLGVEKRRAWKKLEFLSLSLTLSKQLSHYMCPGPLLVYLSYRKWSIILFHFPCYGCGTYMRAMLTRGQCLFQLWVKHWGEYREN